MFKSIQIDFFQIFPESKNVKKQHFDKMKRILSLVVILWMMLGKEFWLKLFKNISNNIFSSFSKNNHCGQLKEILSVCGAANSFIKVVDESDTVVIPCVHDENCYQLCKTNREGLCVFEENDGVGICRC